MSFDVALARSLMGMPKIFAPSAWVDLTPHQQITSGFTGSHGAIDRLEAKIHISAGIGQRANFTLLMRAATLKQRWRIYSLDWNPATRHVNPLHPTSPYSMMIFGIGETHEHHFVNRVSDTNPDQFATPVEKDLPDYPSALRYFCDMINAGTPDLLPPPPAMRTLI